MWLFISGVVVGVILSIIVAFAVLECSLRRSFFHKIIMSGGENKQ